MFSNCVTSFSLFVTENANKSVDGNYVDGNCLFSAVSFQWCQREPENRRKFQVTNVVTTVVTNVVFLFKFGLLYL